LEEIAFLAACTRCDECKKACGHDVIRTHGPDAGLGFKTPYLSFNKKGCQWCEDFPCIAACEPQALEMPEEGPAPVAKLKIQLNHCLVNQGQYCDYCKNACPSGVEPAITMKLRQPPLVDIEKCVGCGECVHICVSQTGKVFELEGV